MIRIAVCDDEASIRSYLISLVRARACPCEIVEYASAGDCLAGYREIDLLFLDIELAPSGPDGMELARKIRERAAGAQPVIIFVTGYGPQAYSAPAKAREVKQTGTQANSFLDMAAQASRGRTDTLATGTSGLMGMAGLPTSLMMDLSVRTIGQVQTGSVDAAEAAEAPSLETMLKAKYPNIHYHVFDASSGYWRTRNDYPHYLLYQDGDKAKETLENWRPSGANPFYGSIDGRFTAPKEIHALGNVPPGSKAVVIHPKVQERMEQDPAYAQEIYAKIDTWFAFDVARNEAIMPGSTWDISQAVAIGEDGNICNACSSSPGRITYSKSGSDDEESWWDLRMARHAEFMKLAVEKQIQRRMQASDLLSAVAAKSQLASMMNGENLLNIFGSEIAGIPTETVLAITRAQVWGGGAPAKPGLHPG